MDLMKNYVEQQIRKQVEEDERTIRSLLGRWVSELEPAVVYRNGKIVGLCVAEAQVGTYPFVLGVV